MPSQENTMDAEENENWIEQHSAATVEWSARKMDRKKGCMIYEAKEAFELKPSGLDTTTEAFEPGGWVAWVSPTLESEGQGKSPPVAKPHPGT